jgi:hypothetical protein
MQTAGCREAKSVMQRSPLAQSSSLPQVLAQDARLDAPTPNGVMHCSPSIVSDPATAPR